MGLTLEISLDKSIREIDDFFNDLKAKAVITASRQALNRAASRTQGIAIKRLRKERNAKLAELKGSKKKGLKGFVHVTKARGNNIANLEAIIGFSGIPLPMILFILGTKKPKRQTSINSRRKSRRFEIIKGKKNKRAGLFIQKAKSGDRQYQVFRRANPNDPSQGFKLQSAPSIAQVLQKKTNILRLIETVAIEILQTEYGQALNNQLKLLKL